MEEKKGFRDFKHWCNLNEEGKKVMGHIFPDGMVPVKNFLGANASLEGQQGSQKVWLINLEMLTSEQFEKLIQIIHEKTKAPHYEIIADVKKDGFIPIREMYVSGWGTSQIGLLL